MNLTLEQIAAIEAAEAADYATRNLIVLMEAARDQNRLCQNLATAGEYQRRIDALRALVE